MTVKNSRSGERAGSQIKGLPRRLDEGPMGKPMANPRTSSIPIMTSRYGVGGWAKMVSEELKAKIDSEKRMPMAGR